MSVNVPGLKQIVVINRTTKALTRWSLAAGKNSPMAFDEANHRVIVGTREPGTISVFDTGSGKMVASVATVQDTDNLHYMPSTSACTFQDARALFGCISRTIRITAR